MTGEFTFEAASELVQKIGQAILADEAFRDDDWEALALVVQVEGAIAGHGFKYYADGSVPPAVPSAIETHFLFKDLAEQMAALEGRPWKTCLAQIKKPELKLRMTYDYDDVNRWMVSPANLDTMRDELRPY